MNGTKYCTRCDGLGCGRCDGQGTVPVFSPMPADFAEVIGALIMFAFLVGVPITLLLVGMSRAVA